MKSVPEISAKTLLAPMKNGQWWFGGDYNMNLYRGCCHGCIYCDSRSECYGNDQFDTVMVKKRRADPAGKRTERQAPYGCSDEWGDDRSL